MNRVPETKSDLEVILVTKNTKVRKSLSPLKPLQLSFKEYLTQRPKIQISTSANVYEASTKADHVYRYLRAKRCNISAFDTNRNSHINLAKKRFKDHMKKNAFSMAGERQSVENIIR